MKRRILLTALLLLLTGCQQTPEQARTVPTAEDEENETSAISSVKELVTAQLNYSKEGGGEYAITLVHLGGLIDSALESGVKDGYIFGTGTSGSVFTVSARPMSYGSTGTRSFFSDETGVIRYTGEDRPATVEDKLLGQ